MGTAQAARLAKTELVSLAHAGLDSFEFRQAASQKIEKAVPFDRVWWWTTDPASAFFTSFYTSNDSEVHDEQRCLAVHANEFTEPDYNKFRVLARRSTHCGVLSVATGGAVEKSGRYRNVITAAGLEHELRLSLVSGSSCWGALTLLRAPDSPDFTVADARAAVQLADPLTDGLRIGLVLGAVASDSVPDGPGLMMLDDDGRTVAMTPAAERWLQELDEQQKRLPEVIRQVASAAGGLDDSHEPEAHSARARVRAPSGRWLVVHGSRVAPGSEHEATTAVIIEEAKPSEIAPIIIEAYELSEREAELTRLVLQGLSTKEIAGTLFLSPYTVQDYLKSVFEKLGVRSRRELVAKMFDQYYWPKYGDGSTPPRPDGGLPGMQAAV
jgi:DNA-binding CsgD family transcriptional regulator